MKSANGQVKMINGQADSGWVAMAHRGYYKWIRNKFLGNNGERDVYTSSDILKVIGLLFSVVGVLTSLRWVLCSLIHDNRQEITPAVASSIYSKIPRDMDASCTEANQENCPWSLVFSDLTNRLQLLEMAFKEQVVARETLEREITNQSDTNVYLNRRLSVFLQKLENVSRHCNVLESKIAEISSRIRSDEVLGIIFFVLILCQLLAKIQPRVKQWMASLKTAKRRGSPKISEERKNSSAPSTPKHTFLKNELCIVLFRRDYSNMYTTMTESMLKHFEEVRLASDPFYIIECQNDIKRLPAVKLYVLIFDCDGSIRCESDHELQIAAVKVIRTLGANIVVVIANDEGSRKLVAHSMYNTNLRIVNSYEDVQELASQGRVFTASGFSQIIQPGKEILKEILNPRVVQPAKERLKQIQSQTFQNARIVGGNLADEGEWPWQVSLQRRSGRNWYHMCGGSILSDHWVVTAAHCVDGQSISSLRIVAGINKLSDSSTGYRSSINAIYKHPEYYSHLPGYPNDIALLRLSTALPTIQGNIGHVSLPINVKDFVGNSNCWITGWGRLSGGGSSPDELYKAKIETIDNNDCTSRWKNISGAAIHEHHICLFEPDKSACSGESAGPFVCKVGSEYVLAGVTSWGHVSCSGAYPSVYVRVSEFVEWIRQYVK